MILTHNDILKKIKKWSSISKEVASNIELKYHIIYIVCGLVSMINYYYRTSNDFFAISIFLKIALCSILIYCYIIFVVTITVSHFHYDFFNHQLDVENKNHPWKQNQHWKKNHLFSHCKFKNHKCPICLLRNNNENLLKFKKCKHVFHKKCIYKWINIQQSSNFNCPCCRESYKLQK